MALLLLLRSSVEYISLCDTEEVMFLAALGVHAVFLAANLFLGGPLWSVDEKYSDARLIVFTSVLAIFFRYGLGWDDESSNIEQRQLKGQEIDLSGEFDHDEHHYK